MRQIAEHHAVVGLYLHSEEDRFELARDIMLHLHCRTAIFGGICTEEVELDHKLAAVADTKTQGVGTGIELAQCFCSTLVPAETGSPAFCRAKNVAVGETTAEYNHIDILESFATAGKVGHMHIANIETCHKERVSHFAVTVDTFLSDNGRTDTRGRTTTYSQVAALETTVEVRTETIVHRLQAEVVATFCCAGRVSLKCVEKIRRLKPYSAHCRYRNHMYAGFVADCYHLFASARGRSDGEVAHSGVVENCLCFGAVAVENLHYNRGIFGKQYLGQIGFANHAEAFGKEVQTAVSICETHLKECCNQTTGTYVMLCGYQTRVDKALHSAECICEEISRFDIGNSTTYNTLCLGKSRATESERHTAEVDIV